MSFLARMRHSTTLAAIEPQEEPMSSQSRPAAGEADHAAAIATARAEGVAAATARFMAIVADDKLKANPTLLAAALDLAAKSDMAGPDIIAFVTANITAPAKSSSPAALANRIAAMGADDPLGAALAGYSGSQHPNAGTGNGWSTAFDAAAPKQRGSAR